jgi:YD repeat-containing protein
MIWGRKAFRVSGMRVKALGIKFGLLLCLFLLFFWAGSAFADTINYVYDNLGRLAMTVSSSGVKIIYSYDQAGHLVSAARTSVNQQPPMITEITPQNAFVGKGVSFTISGENLLTTESVKTDNSGIQIVNYSASDNSITVDAQIQNTATPGAATFTVTTLTGSANISFNLLNLTFTPDRLVVVPGSSESINIHIDGLAANYSLSLTNQYPAIVSAPQSVTIPVASGSADLQITALANGTSVLTGGNSTLPVFVSAPFTGSGTASSGPVSVFINNLFQNGSVASRAVSVSINNLFQNGSVASRAVSAVIGNYLNNGVIVAPLVSVRVGQ